MNSRQNMSRAELIAELETAHKRIALLEKEQDTRFRQIYENMAVGLAIVSLDFKIIGANQAYCQMLGYTEQELIGMHLKKITQPESAHKNILLQARLSQGEIDHYRMEKKFIHKNGQIVYGILDANIIRNTDGTPSYALGSVLDITDRKNTEIKLQNALTRLKFHVENSPLAVIEWTGGNKISGWSSRAEDIFGWSAKEAQSKNWEDLKLVHPKDMPDVVKKIQCLFSGKEQFNTIINRNITKSGKVIHCCWYNSALLDSEGELISILSLVEDITERRQIAENLLIAKEAAEAASRSKSEFLANMSHEIRTPLGGINGMLQLLLDSGLTAKQQEYALAANSSATRLTRLLTDILDVSRIEAGKMTIVNRPFDIKAALNQVYEIFAINAIHLGIALVRDISPEIPKTVIGDPDRLIQIITNLIGNALKFTSSGQITIAAYLLSEITPQKCRILFSVSDTGIGIDQQQLASLFIPFTQAIQGYTREHQGAGLGLAICRRLTELMGGNIFVDSAPGEGTSVYLSFEFKIAPAPDMTERKTENTEMSALKNLKLLLVEDDRVNSLATRVQLEKLGHKVVCVENGLLALDALKKEYFDVIIMDIQMPVMDGMTATREIRKGKAGKGNANIPIIALTAYAMEGDKEKFTHAGMDGYLTKPVDCNALHKTLGEMF